MPEPTPKSGETVQAPIPTRQRFLWGIGGATDFLTYYTLNGLMDAIYVNAMALDPKIIGLARSIPRMLDLVTDPILGYLSDNTRSRWGRRRPWMAAGAILIALVAVLMWCPPLKSGAWASTAYIVGMSVLVFTFGYSMFLIPYTAQGYELSKDYNERTHIFKWRLYANVTIGFLGPWLMPLCILIEGSAGNVTRGANGIHWVSFGMAAVILLAACGPIFGCREQGVHISEKKTKFRDAVKFTLRNKAFWPLVAGNFLVKFGMAVTNCFFYYVMVYHVSGGDNKIGTVKLALFYSFNNIITFAMMAQVVKFIDRIGKKPALMTLMLLSSLTYASVWLTLRPQHATWVLGITSFLHNACCLPMILAEMWPIFITGACIGTFTNSMPLVMNSMLADVCDVDEAACGQQRQAFYGAMFVTCDKLAMAVALLLQGFLVSASGYNSKLVTQAPETIIYWTKALLFTQPVGFILGFFCVLAYPITHAKALEVRGLLDSRKAKNELI